ncbi:MAG: CapA family protein [Acidobacteria bacterium]|nr:CapA family protein [Acidobacteriota bacterium]
MGGGELTLFLCGDVMTGRGVDQILRHPSTPDLHEPFVADAREYVRLAEHASGAVPRSVDPAYIWGDAIAEWDAVAPAVRIMNLETSVTRSDAYNQRKGIHYRMHPENVDCLTAARVDVCVLANNHVLDYGSTGLIETLDTLHHAGIVTVGAGRNLEDARRPVRHSLPGGGHLTVAACAHESSGVPDRWAALANEAGVDLLPDLSDGTAVAVAARIAADKRPGDVAVVSIHWGGNWGYDVPRRHVEFAHRLVDEGVDIVHGHSSHHVRPVEIYRKKLILYGCGDFIDDYEGISGYEQYRDDLVLMFFPTVDPATGRLSMLRMTPLQTRKLRLNRASIEDARWLCTTLNRVRGPFGARIGLTPDGALALAAA